jgi:putative membrane protein
MKQKKFLLVGLIVWYLGLSIWTAYEPADRQFWMMASLLPTLLVIALVATHRSMPLSHASYALITVFLTLHTVGVHYTYAQVPVGDWVDQSLQVGRNHYDRVVHFSFGFLLTYPIEELFRITGLLRGWLLYYVPVMTILGLSGLWEIIESWVARAVHPELGITYLGSQGDPWDAQKDMAAALYGSLICAAVLFALRWNRQRTMAPDRLADSLG